MKKIILSLLLTGSILQQNKPVDNPYNSSTKIVVAILGSIALAYGVFWYNANEEVKKAKADCDLYEQLVRDAEQRTEEQHTTNTHEKTIEQAVFLFMYDKHKSAQAAPFALCKTKIDRHEKNLSEAQFFISVDHTLAPRLKKFKQEVILHPQFKDDMKWHEEKSLQELNALGVLSYLKNAFA